MPVKVRTLREAWWDAWPLGRMGGLGTGYWREQPRVYRVLTRVLSPIHKVTCRLEAFWALLTEKPNGDNLDTWYYRLKAMLLMLGPVEWAYPDYPGHKNCDEVLGWNCTYWNGGEMTCWEATFVAVPYGWRLGRAHLYREGGP